MFKSENCPPSVLLSHFLSPAHAINNRSLAFIIVEILKALRYYISNHEKREGVRLFSFFVFDNIFFVRYTRKGLRTFFITNLNNKIAQS